MQVDGYWSIGKYLYSESYPIRLYSLIDNTVALNKYFDSDRAILLSTDKDSIKCNWKKEPDPEKKLFILILYAIIILQIKKPD